MQEKSKVKTFFYILLKLNSIIYLNLIMKG